MNLISENKDTTINTNRDGKVNFATLLKFDGTPIKKHSWSKQLINTFAYVQKQDGYVIYRLSGNHKFSISEIIPAEVLKHIIGNE